MDTMSYRMNLEKKLFLTYSLNVVDWLLTVMLLSTGQFYEANPLSRMFIQSLTLGFLLKCAVPLLIVVTVIWAMKKLETQDLTVTDRFISFVLVFYMAIILDHFVNFILLFAA